jgi:hypothetical protein
MPARVAVTLLVLTAIVTSCQTLLGVEPTPVPGAAATLTRSSRTPIPTPTRDTNPSPAPSAAAARSPVAAASPSARPGGQLVTDEAIAQIQRDMQRIVASEDLPNIEKMLLDRVSLSTPAGGQVLERAAAADWLRDHAGPNIKVTRVDPNTQTVLLEVQTEGWPHRDPIEEGNVTFSLRRYAPNGRQDEDNGDWKVDVIGAE